MTPTESAIKNRIKEAYDSRQMSEQCDVLFRRIKTNQTKEVDSSFQASNYESNTIIVPDKGSSAQADGK